MRQEHGLRQAADRPSGHSHADGRPWVYVGLILAALLVQGCAQGVETREAPTPPRWTSRTIPEARGEVKEIDGRRVQLRYKEEPFSAVTTNFEQWPTYAYTDTRTFPRPSRVPMPGVKGDPKQGRELVKSRAKGPCTGCHLIPGEDIWPAGSVGPDLSVIGDRRLPDQYLFDFIWDARVFLPNTSMPPWGTAGFLSPDEVAHIVAFLQTLKGNPPFVPPPDKDLTRNPHTRPTVAPYYGDNLDPATNPAIVFAENAVAAWSTRGPAGKACADCHAGGLEKAMKGVAVKYPKYFSAHGRVMSIGDWLGVHAPATTGSEMLAESADNLSMTILIKMQSNGMPVNVDVTSPEARAAYERGRALYFKRVGQRNHACADCHEPDRGGGRYAGARLLSVAHEGLTKHFPLWFMAYRGVWDIRKRFQVCMLPLGMNYLPADAPEYADLELYLTAFDNGKSVSVPGIR
jgi:L-cysteine S-thiosulfotransferase